jgi:hypothetical protein
MRFDVRVSVHHGTILTEKFQQDATVYQNFISYLNEAQHVLDETPSIIRSLKLHKQPLVRTLVDNVQQLHVRQPFSYAKLEAACAVLGS